MKIVPIIVALLLCVAPAQGLICAKDQNNDGNIDFATETVACTAVTGGSYCPFDAQNCTSTSTGYSCPHGSQYACVPNPSTGVMQCSPNACFDQATAPSSEVSADTSSFHGDGPVDPLTGECLGTIMIFNGKPSECRTAGISTSFFNCCDTDQGSFLILKERCGDGDAETVQANSSGRCHLIGDYCKKKWPLIGCVQRANSYCCFNSKLGRIIHEQGRAQLQQFNPNGDWGGPESPNCRGFTPEEFQMLDFSKIDLVEYFADIKTKATQEIQQNMEGKIHDYYENLK